MAAKTLKGSAHGAQLGLAAGVGLLEVDAAAGHAGNEPRVVSDLARVAQLTAKDFVMRSRWPRTSLTKPSRHECTICAWVIDWFTLLEQRRRARLDLQVIPSVEDEEGVGGAALHLEVDDFAGVGRCFLEIDGPIGLDAVTHFERPRTITGLRAETVGDHLAPVRARQRNMPPWVDSLHPRHRNVLSMLNPRRICGSCEMWPKRSQTKPTRGAAAQVAETRGDVQTHLEVADDRFAADQKLVGQHVPGSDAQPARPGEPAQVRFPLGPDFEVVFDDDRLPVVLEAAELWVRRIVSSTSSISATRRWR